MVDDVSLSSSRCVWGMESPAYVHLKHVASPSENLLKGAFWPDLLPSLISPIDFDEVVVDSLRNAAESDRRTLKASPFRRGSDATRLL